ncbi:MAG TPA: flagellar export chaperone FliS [Ruminiclostridium sp.]|jgi:flagellar protein FliS|nr:flagellar export chaperone FliS [Clostridiaceae bacterium]HAA24497.1 flagellar export chaperone FliS [Ruminiclostridium sp.]
MDLSGYNQYRKNSVLTAQPEELTLMLYNGLIKFIMKAQHSISENDLQEAHNNLIKSQNILIELISSLDKSYEISTSLSLLYDYMYRRLVEANVKKSAEILDEVLDLSKQLRDTWEQAIKLYKHPPKKTAAAGS